MSEINIRPMIKIDVEDCTRIHTSSFKGFFLTFLGPRFIKELYTDILIDPTGISFVAEKDREVVGFVVGSLDAPRLYSNLLRNHLTDFAFEGMKAVLRKPVIIPRLLRALKKPAERMPVTNSALLMSIAVMPGMQGHGIGKKLIQAFLDEADRRGLANVLLTTDGVDNESANKFYQGMGFSLLRTYTTPEGRVLNDYVYTLKESPPDTESLGTAIHAKI